MAVCKHNIHFFLCLGDEEPNLLNQQSSVVSYGR